MKHKFLFLFFLYFSITVHAQTVRLIVPFAAGGVADRSARAFEKTLAHRLPYNFNVEYQTGAGGIIAANNVAKNNTKETVLLIHSASIVTNTFDTNSTYDLLDNFVPVALLGSVPMVLVTNRQSGISNLKQLKHTDLPMFYGTSGPGTASHVAGERLQKSINKNLTPVPYRGESAAFNDILTNNITMLFASLSVLTGYANSTQIYMIAITGNQRNADLPTVPTFAEQGVRGFDRSPNWLVILANPGADLAVVTKIKNALADSFNNPKDQEVYRRAGIELNLQPITNVREFLLEEVEKIRLFQLKLKQ